MITDAQFTTWLHNPSGTRCLLVDVDVGLAGTSTVVTRYLSNKMFVTGSSDTPANTSYLSRITTGIKFTRNINLDGTISLSYGDLALDNIDGQLDSWLLDYWSNRSLRIYIGDPQWSRSDFRMVFSGITTGIDSSSSTSINIVLSDKLQRLNVPGSTAVIGGTTVLNNTFVPYLLGECHNVSPVSTNSSTNEYQVHGGSIERVIEVRDNGVPVSFTSNLASGKFTLVNQPYGDITCSVQGAVIPANFIFSSDNVNTAGGWSQANCSVSTTTASIPYQNAIVSSFIANTTNTVHYLEQDISVSAGQIGTFSFFVKQGNGHGVEVTTYDISSGSSEHIYLDFTTGLTTLEITSNFTSSGGIVSSYGAVALGNGWWRVWLSGYPSPTATTRNIQIIALGSSGSSSFAGDGSTVTFYVTGAQYETGAFPTSYRNTSQALGVYVYRNTVAELIRLLVEFYGTTGQQFQSSEINAASFVLFDYLNPQPVGIYLPGSWNVLDTCNTLAASIGAALVVDSTGLLSLVKLNLPQALLGTSVGIADMVEKSLEVGQMVPVVAGVVLGYCQNWTVQTTIAGGVDASSAALFDTEWLTVTRTDTSAATNYNLFTTPSQINTSLIVGSDAVTEANRRLNIFNVQRRVIKYSGFYHLIFENIGAPQTIVHPRFGLSSGVTGQIISISVDFISPHVDFEVLI